MSAASADEALQIGRSISLTCAILDEGAVSFFAGEVAQTLRRELDWPQNALPLIVMTAKPTLVLIRQAIAAGIDEVLATPVTRETLDARLLAVARRGRPLVATAAYVGPCRRRGVHPPQAAAQHRRAGDPRPLRRRLISRETQSYAELYHTARVAIDLLSPSMLALDKAHIVRATRKLHQRALAVRDERIRCVANLAWDAAEAMNRDERELVKLTMALRDLLLLVTQKLRRSDAPAPAPAAWQDDIVYVG